MSFFFKRKSNTNNPHFVSLQKFYNFLNSLLANDKYIAHSDYKKQEDKIVSLIEEIKSFEKADVLTSYASKQHLNIKDLKRLVDYYEKHDELVKKHNEEYLKRHLIEDNFKLTNLLSKVDSNVRLDAEQKEVVLRDADHTLVVAGAGSGKTTVLEAKAKYLVDFQKVDPERILIVSFTRKATGELKSRFKKLNLPCHISTFHSIGNQLITRREEKQNVVDESFLYVNIKNYLEEACKNEDFKAKILLFLASYLEPVERYNDLKNWQKALENNNITTLKNDEEFLKACKNYKSELTKSRNTFRGEKVKSQSECRIANYLFLRGIDYVYEPVYPYNFINSTKFYRPDFLLRQGDKRVYLEHFGINEDLTNPLYVQEDLDKYVRSMRDKIALHKAHGTTLIYTFQNYRDGHDYLKHLEVQLRRLGFVFSDSNNEKAFDIVIHGLQNKYFDKLVVLIAHFISLFKTNNFKISKFDEWDVSIHDERTRLFLSIAKVCFLRYTQALKEQKSVDFNDMINNAIDVLKEKEKNGEKLPYDYIFIDEYQDISLQRFDLAQELKKCSNAKILAVGDDWQSIFRFAGSRVNLFTHFQEAMGGEAEILKINNTYRNSQELLNIVGNFIMKNEQQLKKKLKSNKTLEDPVLIYSFSDENAGQSQENWVNTIEKTLDDIVLRNGDERSVLLIGRFGFEAYSLTRFPSKFRMSTSDKRKIYSVKYPHLKITFLTAHSSKGLGFDDVIIINTRDGKYGFPSKIQEDPIIKLVTLDNNEQEYGEERRLFYVAMTRTKNRVYLVTPESRPSPFVSELMKEYTSIRIRGNKPESSFAEKRKLKCPICGFPLQKRAAREGLGKKVLSLYVCSNEPEICGFVTNDLSGGKMAISKCPACGDGYLIVKAIKKGNEAGKRILGCSNYKEDGTGCNFLLDERTYTQDLRELKQDFSITKDENFLFLGKSLKKIIQMIDASFDELKPFLADHGPLTFNQTVEFFKGEESPTSRRFSFQNYKSYGLFADMEKNEIKKLFRALLEVDYLEKVSIGEYKKVVYKGVLEDKNFYRNLRLLLE